MDESTRPGASSSGFTTALVSDVLQKGDLLAQLAVMVADSSRDTALCDATYLPANMDYEKSVEYLRSLPPPSWAVLHDGSPCGLYLLRELSSGVKLDLPANCYEREVWLLPEYRGRSVVNTLTASMVQDMSAMGVDCVLALVWSSNSSAKSMHRRSGFTSQGPVWWEEPGFDPGWCEAYVLHLTADHQVWRSREDSNFRPAV